MLLALIASLAVAALVALLGLPFGLARPGSRASLSTLAIDSMLAGTALLICVVSLWTWGGPVVAAAGLLATFTAAGVALRRGGRIDLTLLRPRWSWFALGVAAIFVVGTMLRLRTVEFVPRAGDMGDYVNAANRLVRSGELGLGFPPGFAVYLALPSWLLGVGSTTASVPFLGVLLMGAVLRLTGQLGLRREARLAALAVLSFSTVAVWYSSFPVSETLQAPLTIMLVWLVGAHVTGSARSWTSHVADLTLLAVTGLALGFTRGTGPLLLLPLAALLAPCLHPAWRRYGPGAARALGATTAGLAISYVYGVDRISAYFVDLQISSLLPTRIFSVMSRLGLLRLSIPLVLLWLGVVAAAFVLAEVLQRWADRGDRSATPAEEPSRAAVDAPTAARPPWRWPFAVGVVLALATVGLLLLAGPGEIWNQFGRMNPALLAVGVVALVLPGALRGVRGPSVVLAAAVMVLMLAVQVPRFDTPRAHSFFLYWDRYLFSEVLPILVVLAGLTVSVALEWVARRASASDGVDPTDGSPAPLGRFRPLALGSVTVLVLAFVGTQVNGLRLVTDDTVLAGTASMYEQLDDLLADDDRAILWTASGDGPDGWPIFPNSWHAFGLPLEATYGRSFVNPGPPDDPFRPDEVLDTDRVDDLLACHPSSRVYAIEFSRQGNSDLDERLEGSAVDLERVGDVSVDAAILRHLNTKVWEEMPMRATVWDLTADPASLPECRDRG